MKVQVMRIRTLPEGKGKELGHGFDRYYENSGEFFYIPNQRLPLLYRECFPGWVEWDNGGVVRCNYWVVATSDCPVLPEGTVCRLYTPEGVEVGKL
jgi:hypothetical protein